MSSPEEEKRHRDRACERMLIDDVGRDAAARQGMPMVVSKPPETGKRPCKGSPREPLEEAQPADTLILDFQPPELGE